MKRPYRRVQPFPVAYSQLRTVQYAVCCKIISVSFARVSGWTLNGIWSFLRRCPHANLKVSGRVTLLPGTELRPVSFNKRQQNKEAFFQKHSWRTHVSPMFPHTRNISRVSSFFKMQITLNPSMRALAKILQAQASEHSSNVWEQFKQRPNFASTFKLDGTIRYPFPCYMYWTQGQYM